MPAQPRAVRDLVPAADEKVLIRLHKALRWWIGKWSGPWMVNVRSICIDCRAECDRRARERRPARHESLTVEHAEIAPRGGRRVPTQREQLSIVIDDIADMRSRTRDRSGATRSDDLHGNGAAPRSTVERQCASDFIDGDAECRRSTRNGEKRQVRAAIAVDARWRAPCAPGVDRCPSTGVDGGAECGGDT